MSSQKQIVADLLAKANKYRQFARWITDRPTVQGIQALALELKQQARALARPEEAQIRRRAHEIWEENGRLGGRDVEFWLQAESEIREAEALVRNVQDEP